MSLGEAGAAGTGEGAAGASGGAGNSGAGKEGAGNLGGAAAGGTASWRDSLPEEIRTNSHISSFTDVAALAKSHIHAQGIISKKGAVPPADWSKATPEEKAGFYGAIGMPAADKYELAAPAGTKISPEVTTGFCHTRRMRFWRISRSWTVRSPGEMPKNLRLTW